jgi:hypothetical protein
MWLTQHTGDRMLCVPLPLAVPCGRRCFVLTGNVLLLLLLLLLQKLSAGTLC